MTREVFISYSSTDKALADEVCEGLEGAGLNCWIAPRDIVPGSAWGEAIIDGINSSQVMVLLFSQASNDSNQVLREVERCVAKRIPIIPFRLDKSLPSKSFEYFLSSSHWMEAQSRPLAPLIPKLEQTIRTLLENKQSRPAVSQPSENSTQILQNTQRRSLIIGTGVATALGATGAGYWWFKSHHLPLDPSAVAVLPFSNLNKNEKVDYLSLAVASELDSRMATLQHAVVRPLDSVKSFLGDKISAQQVAQALQVGTLVMGNFWSLESRIRLNVTIVDAKQNRQIWAQTFESHIDQLLNLFDNMVPKVTNVLAQRLGSEPTRQPDNSTRNPQAFELYLQASSLALDITKANNEKSLDLLKRAVALDDHFARAYAALAQAQVTHFYWNFSNDTQWLDQAQSSAKTALQLDPQLPDAHNALAFSLEGMGKRAQAAKAFLGNVELSQNYAPGLKNAARWLFYMADFPASLYMLERVHQLDPLSNTAIRRAMCHFFMGNKTRCKIFNERAQKQAKGVDQLTLVAFVWTWLGEEKKAREILQKLQALQPNAFSIDEVKAWLAATGGQKEIALAQIKKLEQRATFGIYDEIATLYAILDMPDPALQWLGKATRMGAPNLAWYQSEFFSSLRAEPEYQSIIDNLRQEYRPLLRQFHDVTPMPVRSRLNEDDRPPRRPPPQRPSNP